MEDIFSDKPTFKDVAYGLMTVLVFVCWIVNANLIAHSKSTIAMAERFQNPNIAGSGSTPFEIGFFTSMFFQLGILAIVLGTTAIHPLFGMFMFIILEYGVLKTAMADYNGTLGLLSIVSNYC